MDIHFCIVTILEYGVLGSFGLDWWQMIFFSVNICFNVFFDSRIDNVYVLI